MRASRALLLAAAALATAGAARAQEAPAGLPPGAGTLRGRIVREAPGAVGGLPVVLYAMPPDGDPGLGRTVSGADGSFVFEGVASEPGIAYLVGVRADDLPYGTRTSFAPGESVHEVELVIASPTDDASGIARRAARLRLEAGCGGLRVTESHELRNPGERVVFVPEAQRAGRPPLLEVVLPEGAGPISVPFGSQGLAQDGNRVAYWGPLHPGVHEIELAYSLPTGDAELAWGLPQGVAGVEVLTDPAGPGVQGSGLRAGPPREVEGRSYATHAAGPIAPGESLRLRLAGAAPAAPAAVQIAEAQSWLELDDAALVVDASWRLEVAGDAPLAASAGAPLLCIPLPPEASGLRFSQATLAMGAEPDPSGELALRGPIPAGASAVVLRYRIPVEGDRAVFAQRFASAVPIWSVLVADTGVAVETTRLHRRRPMRSDERSFLHLEAFELEPGEEIELSLRRLPPRRAPPRLAQAGFSLAIAAAGIAFLVAPLQRRREEPIADASDAKLETERESIRAALASLEEDFETGKLAAADYEELRDELRARLGLLIAQRRAAGAAGGGLAAAGAPENAPGSPGAVPALPSPARCAACAAELAAEARFCHRCGQAVAPAARD